MNKKIFAAILFPLLWAACGKEGDDPTISGLYFSDFSNGWTVEKDSLVVQGIFFPLSTITDSSRAAGFFDGNLQQEALNRTLAIYGTFQSIYVTMTISKDSLHPGTPPIADSIYTGYYDTVPRPFRIRLINTAGSHDSLVLKQGN